MKRRERLHDHFAFHLAPARASRHLRQQLKRPFPGAKIRLMQAQVGVNDADQCDVWKMETLRDHLGADEDVNLARAKIAQDSPVIVLAFERVGVHAPHARPRKQLRQCVLDLFRAESGVTNRRVAAFHVWTKRRRLRLVTANVAEEPLPGPVIGQRHAAIGALGHEAALWALQRRRVAAAIQKQHHLLASLQPQGDFLLELLRKNGRALLLARFLPHVDDAHERHFPVGGALRQLEQRVFPLLRVVETLERGCG